MIKFIRILILGMSLVVINSCAKPTVVNVVMPGDENLDCKQLEAAVAEAQNFKRKAEFVKEGTGANTTRVLLFWPAWAKTLHNADIAIVAADDRNYHLLKIMRKKNCKGIDSINAEITGASSSKNNISKELNELNALYKSGALTEDEFKKAKKKVLNK
jgi:hypothetical protein